MESIVVVFSKPGAGKGTRIGKFEASNGHLFDVLSVGDMLRAERKKQTELGKKAESYMKSGQLVPDEIINEIVINSLKTEKNPVITDGYPRTVAQAEAMLDAGIIPEIVIELEVPDNIVIERAKDRIVCSECGASYTLNEYHAPKKAGICDKCSGKLIKREDDNEETVKERLKVYHEETYPALKVFKNYGVEIYKVDNTKDQEATERFEELLIMALSK